MQLFVIPAPTAHDAPFAATEAQRTIAEPLAALRFRGQLPGAFGFDHAAFVVSEQVRAGTHPLDLLPLVFPTSWMVNSRASSQTFQMWMVPDALEKWETIIDPLHAPGASWATLGADVQNNIANAVAALASVRGGSLSAVTKVLALLLCDAIPIMADAEVAMITGAMAAPTEGDTTTADVSLFANVMHWYSQHVPILAKDLQALAAQHPLAPLTALQTLDRLIWYASWGRGIDGAAG
jgi:hypothetical protein